MELAVWINRQRNYFFTNQSSEPLECELKPPNNIAIDTVSIAKGNLYMGILGKKKYNGSVPVGPYLKGFNSYSQGIFCLDPNVKSEILYILL